MLTPETIKLKEASAEVIKANGGVDAAAGFCRVGKSKLSENQNVACEDSFMALDVIRALEPLGRARPGWPHITRELCRANGGAFVELPQPGAPAGDLAACAGRHAKEASEITARLFEAMKGGTVTAEQIGKFELEREAREAVEASVQLLAMIQAIKEERE